MRILLFILLLLPVLSARAQLEVPPVWDGDPNTTRQYFAFLTDDNPALPDEGWNPYGGPSAQMQVASGGAGWMDPAFLGFGQGAWDLGPQGSVEVLVPVAESSVQGAAVEVVVDVLYYQDLTQPPTLEAPWLNTPQDEVVWGPRDPVFLGFWNRRRWQGLLWAPASGLLPLTVLADSFGSVVDEVTVYTRPAPERNVQITDFTVTPTPTGAVMRVAWTVDEPASGQLQEGTPASDGTMIWTSRGDLVPGPGTIEIFQTAPSSSWYRVSVPRVTP